jgi:dihydroxy-acid dehydratase
VKRKTLRVRYAQIRQPRCRLGLAFQREPTFGHEDKAVADDLGAAEHIWSGVGVFMRGMGPIGYSGAAEFVDMRATDFLLKRGITSLPCIGDGRQSGISRSPSILNASPEAATGGELALLKTGDKVRISLKDRTADILISDAELAKRRAELAKAGGYKFPESQTPWQEIQRGIVDELSHGMVLKPAVKYQKIAATKGIPRDNH